MARPAPAVTRALHIIDLLVTHPGHRFTLSEIVQRTGISLGSAHAVLGALEDDGYVSRHRTHKTYGLGPALVAAGVAAVEHQPAVRAAIAELGPLADRLGTATVVTAPTRDEIIFVARAGRPTPWGPEVRDGERVPLVPPLGAVFMAWADDEAIGEWLDRAPRADAERARNVAMLEVVRSRGYAIGTASPSQDVFGSAMATLADDPTRAELRAGLDALIDDLTAGDYEVSSIDPDATYGIGMIASPVFDGDEHVVAAIVAHGFPPDLTATAVVEAAEQVRASAVVATKTALGRFPAVDRLVDPA